MKFDFASYIELVERYRSSGYDISSFAGEKQDTPHVILRHDVDLSPAKAREMAEVEARSGIQSTYLVMVSSPFYNPVERDNDKAIKDILDMGHEIGLHFDSTKYGISNIEELQEPMMREIQILEAITMKPVKSVSSHIPANFELGSRIPFLDKYGIKNAYDEKYFRNHKYLSDSKMRWREDPFSYIDTEKHPYLQILTHPVWYGEEQTSRNFIIYAKRSEKRALDNEYLKMICPEVAL